jgi:hypothetical protein
LSGGVLTWVRVAGRQVICECFRFKHFAPFGIPHATTEDTTLGGYRVPKDAQVGLSWALCETLLMLMLMLMLMLCAGHVQRVRAPHGPEELGANHP